MRDTHSNKPTANHIVLIVLVDILVLSLVIAAGYFWMDGRFKQMDQRIDDMSPKVDTPDTGHPDAVPPIAPVTQYRSKKGDMITITTPLSNATISSPLKITGKAPGSWFFEGQFSISLKDSAGNVVAKGPTDISKDWQTDGPVTFNATLKWTKTVKGNGVLVLQKDNPSGLAKNDDSVEIPVKF